MPLLNILGLGFILGMRHATDADHVVAVSAIVSKHKTFIPSALVGILWGLGHSVTVTLVAIPIVLFSFAIPPRLGLGLEFLVGLMLVLLGMMNVFGNKEVRLRSYLPIFHKHEHDRKNGSAHAHFHLHFKDKTDHSDHRISLRPVLIGLVHGLAGSAAIAILVISTIQEEGIAVLYLFIFNIGVIIGMMFLTSLLGFAFMKVKKINTGFHMMLVVVSGALSLFFGILVLYETGVVGGLFGSSIHWNPR
ncbi:MAG: high-affinity nickel-transport family protein [Candidatus Levybacteria bacterium]|nr:high-affinity nickel-transport family protein [Candidatus Levybacteria bacterium]